MRKQTTTQTKIVILQYEDVDKQRPYNEIKDLHAKYKHPFDSSWHNKKIHFSE